jgi:hypothetical protein
MLGWSVFVWENSKRKNWSGLVLKDANIYKEQLLFYDFLKILKAPSRALASNIEKMAKKFKNLQFFFDFFKSFGPNKTFYKLFDASCRCL